MMGAIIRPPIPILYTPKSAALLRGISDRINGHEECVNMQPSYMRDYQDGWLAATEKWMIVDIDTGKCIFDGYKIK